MLCQRRRRSANIETALGHLGEYPVFAGAHSCSSQQTRYIDSMFVQCSVILGQRLKYVYKGGLKHNSFQVGENFK